MPSTDQSEALVQIVKMVTCTAVSVPSVDFVPISSQALKCHGFGIMEVFLLQLLQYNDDNPLYSHHALPSPVWFYLDFAGWVPWKPGFGVKKSAWRKLTGERSQG